MSLRLLGTQEPEVLQAIKRVTLDEAHALACRVGRPEIGSAWNGHHAAELKLNEEYGGGHYISLKCSKYPTAAENLMDCVRTAELIRAALRGTP